MISGLGFGAANEGMFASEMAIMQAIQVSMRKLGHAHVKH